MRIYRCGVNIAPIFWPALRQEKLGMTNLENHLRTANERTVALAMDRANVTWPIRDYCELPEAYNSILDQLGVPDADGDVIEPEE